MLWQRELRAAGPIGAKYDTSVHATKAEKAGARLETSAVVVRLATDAERRVSAVLGGRTAAPDRPWGAWWCSPRTPLKRPSCC